MEVHEVRMPTQTLEPGEIFTIEPEMHIEEDHLGLRLEDLLLITVMKTCPPLYRLRLRTLRS